jgi:hypothetical protein
MDISKIGNFSKSSGRYWGHAGLFFKGRKAQGSGRKVRDIGSALRLLP